MPVHKVEQDAKPYYIYAVASTQNLHHFLFTISATGTEKQSTFLFYN